MGKQQRGSRIVATYRSCSGGRKDNSQLSTTTINRPRYHQLIYACVLAVMSAIPLIENAWRTLTSTVSEYHLKTTVTFVIHELFYWGSYLPFLFADYIPYCKRWKIQPDKPITPSVHSNCIRRVVANHFLLVLPIILLTHPLFDLMGAQHTVETLPPLHIVAMQVAIFFAIEDLVFYYGHRLLHTPYLYRTVHIVHHEHAAPFGLAAEYAHPVEVMFLGMATVAGPAIFGPHLFTLYIYLALRCMQTVECHSGYDFPWSPNRWIPLYGGAKFHDHHHRIHSGNYSSTFIWADRLYNTDSAYQIWKKKQSLSSKSL